MNDVAQGLWQRAEKKHSLQAAARLSKKGWQPCYRISAAAWMFNLRERPQPETEIDHETRLPGVGVIGKHDGIRAIRIPRRAREFEWFCKVGARSAQAIAKVGVAIVKDAGGWRVVAHSVAPAVCRCPALETALDAGQTFSSPEEVADVLHADISPIDDLRSTAEYRQRVLSRLIYFRLLDT